ncbi:MAG: lipopolysaccharide transport periplasmic protein LptA [Gammaproteobacteria bacterium]|nr:lipopolysaccharide transport periplasmic protein LptA [Gammaproteobacteria bacterium]
MTSHHKHLNKLAALALGALLTSSAWAGEITIEADFSEFDQASGKHLLEGNVVAKQDGMVLSADKIELTSEEGVVTLVLAKGSPTTLTTDEGMRGQAKQITYNALSKFATFEFDALVEQGARSIAGEKIDADLTSDFLRAEGKNEKRVKLSFPVAE